MPYTLYIEYYLFIETEDGKEKLIALSPSLDLITRSADHMVGKVIQEKRVVASRVFIDNSTRHGALIYSAFDRSER